MKKLLTSLSLFIASKSIYAEEAPFGKVEDKAQQFLDFLTGGFVTTVLAIAIVVAGLMLARGKGNPQLMWGIVIGAIIIGSSGQIASWLIA